MDRKLWLVAYVIVVDMIVVVSGTKGKKFLSDTVDMSNNLI